MDLFFLQAAKMRSRSAKFRFIIALLLLCVVPLAMYSNLSWDSTMYYFQPRESSSCACDKCLTDGDPYFTELLNSSPNPFLSRNHPTPVTDFNVWKSWQRERRNFTFYNMTVEKVLQTFPPAPDDLQRRPNRCRMCAVVGNSGTLKGSHYGPLIDFHDIVIRMNRGRTKGFETDVGTKTTHHVLYPQSATQLDNTTHLVFFPFNINDFLWLLKHFSPNDNSAVNAKTIANKDLVMILNPAFMRHVHHTWLKKRGYYPSTGFMALILSLQICDEVSVFGFGADSNGNWDHYYEPLRNKRLKTGNHPGTSEMEVIRELHNKQKIEFYKGW